MKKPNIVLLPPVSLGLTVNENLPFPIVHYPGHYGTFIAFSKDNKSQPFLCSCSRSAVVNYLKLRKINDSSEALDPLMSANLEDNDFPSVMATSIRSKENQNNNFEALFRSNLCHRCNMKTPSVRWCHEMYGVSFVQYYGWYIYQTYFRLGITQGPITFTYLPETCPDELQKDIEELLQIEKKFQILEKTYFDRLIISSNELNLNNSDKKSQINNDLEHEEYLIIKRELSQNRRKFTTKIENITRTEFGFKKVGEGWISETLLFKIISHMFPNNQIFRHFRPDWLNRLELDIYLPELKLAFEYQGQQHFYAVKAWGGENALLAVQARDKVKADLCKLNGINLITIDYTEPLTEDYLRLVINNNMNTTSIM